MDLKNIYVSKENHRQNRQLYKIPVISQTQKNVDFVVEITHLTVFEKW